MAIQSWAIVAPKRLIMFALCIWLGGRHFPRVVENGQRHSGGSWRARGIAGPLLTMRLRSRFVWHGGEYDKVADPQHRWGVSVIDRLPGEAISRILDAGCGSGRVTEEVLDRQPRAEVVAIDVSSSMLEAAARRLERFGARARLCQVGLDDGDGLRSLGTFDAVISTGTFHWVLDHGAMFRDLRSLLPDGGVLASQSGGEGSVLGVRTILTELGVEWQSMNNYANVADTCDRLAAAGFSEIECWMTDEPVVFEDRPALEAYVLDGVIAPYVSDRSPSERAAIAAAVADRLPDPVLHFVRLNIRAVATS